MVSESKWRHHGVRVVKADQLDPNTAQTPGMNRAAAINRARMGAEKLWAGTVVIHPNAKTGAPHQEINASESEPLSCVLCRSGQEPVVVNLDLPNVEPNPENVPWVDNIHRDPGTG